MKNKLVIVLTLMLSLLLAVISVSAIEYNSPCQLDIKLVNQDPNPAVPNNYVKILFQITGLENPYCPGASVKLQPEYPFSLDSNVDQVQVLKGSTFVSGYQTAWMVPYRLRVSADALESVYKLKLLYTLGGDADFSNAAGLDFNVSVTDVLTDFDAVIQEISGTQVSVGIVNTGKNMANSLVASIPSQDSFRSIGPSAQIVGNLASGDYTIISFNLASKLQRNTTRNATRPIKASLPLASSPPFEENDVLHLKIDYTDGIGKRRSTTKDIMLNTALLQNNSVMYGSGGRNAGNSNSSFNWWYVAGGILGLALIVLIYKKYFAVNRSFQRKSYGAGSSSESIARQSVKSEHKK